MTVLRIVTVLVALLLAGGEAARWWSSPRFMPLAFDELVVAAAMLATALWAPRFGAAPLAAAWGLFCGLVLGLLVPTLDHLLHGPEKASAGFYAAVLAAMLALGLIAMSASLRLGRPKTKH
jgi:hypothetical protein